MPEGIACVAEDADIQQPAIESREVAGVQVDCAQRYGERDEQEPDD